MKHLSNPGPLALRGVLICAVETTNSPKIQGPECESLEHAAASNHQGRRKAAEPQVRAMYRKPDSAGKRFRAGFVTRLSTTAKLTSV